MTKKYRLYSVMRNLGWMAVAIIMCTLTMLFIRLIMPKDGVLCGLLFTALLALGLADVGIVVIGGIVAIYKGLRYPYCSDHMPHWGWRLFAMAFGILGVLCIGSFIYTIYFTAVLFFAANTTPEGYAAATYHEAEKGLSSLYLENIPRTATDIDFRHGSSFFFEQTSISCHVSESDVLAFACEKGYPLGTNTFYNANAETRREWPDLNYMGMAVDQNRHTTCPTNFLSYAYIYTNAGGVYYIYDRDAERLYYHYSTN